MVGHMNKIFLLYVHVVMNLLLLHGLGLEVEVSLSPVHGFGTVC